ncbi:succinate dehydrogenase, cytochrome b556 subunit [Iodidimonas sp. SYSU 1G8]|uniref:succinate dehydrogenase, cytochrome b556 subunit n=1 Tax=Iodidimonas sp. SYSU 1G8 TaxID=3133967 RepID=UPI0031FEF941
MAQVKRPVSPHLQVYRWTVTMASSILHRATGVGLAAGAVWLAWWLIAAATSYEAFECVQAFSASIVGMILLLGVTWALMFHLLNGIRHLVWDVGHGFDVATATRSGWAVVIGSVVLTVLAWGIGLTMTGGY